MSLAFRLCLMVDPGPAKTWTTNPRKGGGGTEKRRARATEKQRTILLGRLIFEVA